VQAQPFPGNPKVFYKTTIQTDQRMHTLKIGLSISQNIQTRPLIFLFLQSTARAWSEPKSKHRICLEVGVVANKKATSKSNNIGSKQDQEKRGNDRSMNKRCELQGINYWPVPVEGGGQTSAKFEAFL
jgi:hypothetical protein